MKEPFKIERRKKKIERRGVSVEEKEDDPSIQGGSGERNLARVSWGLQMEPTRGNEGLPGPRWTPVRPSCWHK